MTLNRKYLDEYSFEGPHEKTAGSGLHKTVLSEEGLAWSPNGKEVWFSATRGGLQRQIYAVDLTGHLRLAFR
ncbi:MAG TPA: hypothetical protein VGJ73_22355, partial [Verrucomicrobiae bacterium]